LCPATWPAGGARRLASWCANNSAIKLHLLFDPTSEAPTWFSITPARFHDSKVRGAFPIAAKHMYAFDRAYNNAAFWKQIDDAGAVFVTRAKTNLAHDVIEERFHPDTLIVADETARLARKPGEKYRVPLRGIEIFDEGQGREIAFLTNDFERPAEDIAALHKRRWQIELFPDRVGDRPSSGSTRTPAFVFCPG